DRGKVLGLDFLALTDHDSLVGLKDLNNPSILVIPGCEISTFLGHFVAYGVSKTPFWYKGETLLTPSEMATFVREQGGLFGLAHPFVLGDPICVGCRLELKVQPRDLDFVDIWSRGSDDPVANEQALKLFDKIWREGLYVTAIAGRDWHGPNQEEATAGYRFPATVVHSEPEPKAILEAVRKGACYLSVGPIVDFSVECDGKRAGLGEYLGSEVDSQQKFSARVYFDSLEEPAVLRVICGGQVAHNEKLSPGSGRREFSGLCPKKGSVRMEIWSENMDERLVITNPIRFR
ncbi:MAG: CehA/McbA family metallohydrolase, partial [Pseudomonadota bacterium]